MNMKDTMHFFIFLRGTTHFFPHYKVLQTGMSSKKKANCICLCACVNTYVRVHVHTHTHNFYLALITFSASFPALVISDFSNKKITSRNTCQDQVSKDYFRTATKRKKSNS